MAKTPTKPQRRNGRPTKQEELARALGALGCDPDLISPKRILAGIAADADVPPQVRVNACRVLLKLSTELPVDDADGLDELTRRAMQMGRTLDA